MKNRLSAFLVRRSRFILVLFVVIAIGCGALIPFVNVNRDMTEYLAEDSSMRRGLDIMRAEFGNESSSTLKLMFDDLSDEAQKDAILHELESLEYVSSVDYEPGSDDYNRDQYTLYVINCDYGQYSDEASSLYSEVKARYGSDHNISLGGTIESANHSGLPVWIVVAAVALIFLILLIMANSWIEPLTFLVTIAVAVLINMGTYVLFPSISKTTFGIVAILQLVLSMDYSIMLLNRYRQQRQLSGDKNHAMREALSLSFGAISGSSLTTFAGLMALLFMSFGIGADIGLALAKGVLISLLCVFTVLPSMLLACDGLMLNTAKKTLSFDWPRFSNFEFKMRIPLTLLFALLFAGGFVIRNGVDFSYAQYGTGDEIEEVFGLSNSIVMIYNEKDGDSAGRLADVLSDRDDINSAACYESTLGRQRTAEEMQTFISDMSDSLDSGSGDDSDGGSAGSAGSGLNNSSDGTSDSSGSSDSDSDSSDGDSNSDSDGMNLSEAMLRMIYYDYHTGDPDFTLTISEFVSYLCDEVLADPDFADALDDDARDKIRKLSKYADAGTLTTKMSAKGLADFFGMSLSQAKQLLLYYQIKSGNGSAGTMTLPSFVDFLINDVAKDSDYKSMFDSASLRKLKAMQVYTEKKAVTTPVTYETAADVLGMDSSQIRLVYVYKHAGEAAGSEMTIAELASALETAGSDPVLSSRFDSDQLAQLVSGLQMIALMDQTPYSVSGMVQALAAYNIPLGQDMLVLIYSYRDVCADPGCCKVSVQNIVKYMLSEDAVSGSMTKAQKSQLKTLKKIIDTSVSGKRLSVSAMSNLLGMSRNSVRSIYLLHSYKRGNTGSWKLSPKQFIDFLVDKVLKSSSMKSRIGDSADDLKLARKLIDSVAAGKEFSYGEMADLFGEYSDEMDADSLCMMYELYGSDYSYDESWTMDLTEMVRHIDENMLSRSAFASAIDDEQAADLHEMRNTLDEYADKLRGEHYGRMITSADLPEDSDESRALMAELTDYTRKNFSSDTYFIGTTPMAYEMSLTFRSELNLITLLTAIFILIIVLLTFRRLAAPVILVLVIQCAVFMTMGIMNFLNVDMNYLALLIVQSIMMGATIDYAIIYTTYYIESRVSLPPAEAIRAALKGSLQTILTSATILIVAVGLLSFAFSEPATRQICRILSVGCLMSTILIIFILPGILACFDRFVKSKERI